MVTERVITVDYKKGSTDRQTDRDGWMETDRQTDRRTDREVYNQCKYMYPILYDETDMNIHGQMDNIVRIYTDRWTT